MTEPDLPPAPPFTPVATRARHDGWTPERQRDFLAALAACALVSRAAASVGMSAKSAYALKKRAGPDHDFTRAWDMALDEGQARTLDRAVELSLKGERIPVFYGGRQIGERVRHDPRVLIATLRTIGRMGARERHDAPHPIPTKPAANPVGKC